MDFLCQYILVHSISLLALERAGSVWWKNSSNLVQGDQVDHQIWISFSHVQYDLQKPMTLQALQYLLKWVENQVCQFYYVFF